MKKTTQNAVTSETIKTEKTAIVLKSDVSGNKLKRKLTNEAKKQAVKDAREDERKLSTHYKKLTKFASDYVRLLSDETGKPITAEQIANLKYADFLPFITIREEYSNTTNGWTFPRLLNVVSRFFRGEKKSQVTDSILSDVE
jgi:hypothetical protein